MMKLCFLALVVPGLTLRMHKEQPKDFSSQIGVDSSIQMEKTILRRPMTKDQLVGLELTGLRSELKEKLASDTTVYFIGDSLIRNQYHGFCYLLDPSMATKEAPDFEALNDTKVHTCKGANGVTAYHFWSRYPMPGGVQKILDFGAPPPSLITWDSAMWARMNPAGFKEEPFSKALLETSRAYAAAAPDANLVFFLSSATCPKSRRVTPRELIKSVNGMAMNMYKDQKDGKGRPVRFNDGFTLTLDKCDATLDGVHFNTLVWDELKMMFQSVKE